MTPVYLARQRKATISVTTETVNSDPELGLNNLSTLFDCNWPCGPAWKWALKKRCWWCCCRYEPRISQWVGGKGRGKTTKGICCFDWKVVIWEISFFLLPSKTEWALVYCPEALCLHREVAMQTVQKNWICRLGRYLMDGHKLWLRRTDGHSCRGLPFGDDLIMVKYSALKEIRCQNVRSCLIHLRKSL